jgi:uncharacterized protein (TIGR02452 family)
MPRNKDKKCLKAVAHETQFKCSQGRFRDAPLKPSVLYPAHFETNPCLDKYSDPAEITVVNRDTFRVCQDLIEAKKGYSVCALNMASSYHPGGGWEKGSMAQEEELFRRSNYFLTLKHHFYPLKPGCVVYSPLISIIKDEDYEDLRRPVSVAMIAAAAPKYPDAQVDSNKVMRYSHRKDFETVKQTIDLMFQVASDHRHDVLVLGAWGCGCYGNPPHDVIDIFNWALQRYSRCFKKIVFAVLSKRDDNFELFSRHIKTSFPSPPVE